MGVLAHGSSEQPRHLKHMAIKDNALCVARRSKSTFVHSRRSTAQFQHGDPLE
jgi:hypothetical protein